MSDYNSDFGFYKKGRGWGAECFCPEFDEQSGTFTFDPNDDIERLREILEIDANAIFVNPYYNNLGPTGEMGMTRDTLAKGLRWQYDIGHARLDEVLEDASADSEPDNSADTQYSSEAETSATLITCFIPGCLPSRQVRQRGGNFRSIPRTAASVPLRDTRQRPPPDLDNLRQERSA